MPAVAARRFWTWAASVASAVVVRKVRRFMGSVVQ
jgi:hypothetical protein